MILDSQWLLTPQLVAIHLPTATAVVADIHLGYHATRRRRGEPVPEPSLDELLKPLDEVLQRCSLSQIVVAGDLFEDGVDDAVMGKLIGWLDRRSATLHVVPGNHDRRLVDRLPGITVYHEGFALQSWLVLHGDSPLPNRPVVCGHLHPSLRVGPQTFPCYLAAPDRLLLPAYCREARGGSVKNITSWRQARCYVPVGQAVLDFGIYAQGANSPHGLPITRSGRASSRVRSRSGRTTSGRPPT